MTALDSSPSIFPLYLKAALPIIPGASTLPFVPGGGTEIPDGLGFELTGVVSDPKRVSDYARICGFRLRDSLPPTYPHLLAFPLQMAIMSDGSFPFGAVGLVHIENRVTQLRPVGITEPLDIKVTPTPLADHHKGQVFSLLTEASVAGEAIWSETSTMLRRGKSSENAAPDRGLAVEALDPETPASANWKLPGDLGRRYGAISGDRNPIHMHALTAKPLGFSSAIAHGMWTKARALAQLESRLPGSFTAEVRFRKPIFLPARVEFASIETSGQTLFSVRGARDRTPHLDGSVRANPPTAKASN